MNIVLIGPPAAGKGTQSENLVKEFNLFKVSTGDLLRNEINKKNPLASKIKSIIDKGLLVSDDVINNLVGNIMSKKEYFNRLIFDGYPRNINQAIKLSTLLKKYNQKIFCVLSLKVEEKAILKRVTGRQICSKCGLIFNEFLNPVIIENHSCDPKFLHKRSDDNIETIKNRFDTYNKETLPILDHYKNQNLLYEIDGMSQIHEIYEKIRQIIDSLET